MVSWSDSSIESAPLEIMLRTDCKRQRCSPDIFEEIQVIGDIRKGSLDGTVGEKASLEH